MPLKSLCFTLATLLFSVGVWAIDTHRDLGEYRVHFSVMNTTKLPPAVAEAHGITRARDRALINVSLTRPDQPGYGQPAQVSGTATNLMQQSRQLEFREVREADAVYYIAPLEHIHEEVIHFDLSVQPEGSEAPLEVRFKRKLHQAP